MDTMTLRSAPPRPVVAEVQRRAGAAAVVRRPRVELGYDQASGTYRLVLNPPA